MNHAMRCVVLSNSTIEEGKRERERGKDDGVEWVVGDLGGVSEDGMIMWLWA